MRKKISHIIEKLKIKTNRITELNYNAYVERKKIVVYVPVEYSDKLMFDMASAGAGEIGNYSYCSFRMKGLGTYKPGSMAKPFAGKKGSISFAEEVRLEMECGEKELDAVIDIMLQNHPYEEVAYEIYDFKKRREMKAYIINTGKQLTVKELIKKLGMNIVPDLIKSKIKINKILISEEMPDKRALIKARKSGCRYLIIFFTNKINLIQI